jgi:hypothetical protein
VLVRRGGADPVKQSYVTARVRTLQGYTLISHLFVLSNCVIVTKTCMCRLFVCANIIRLVNMQYNKNL